MSLTLMFCPFLRAQSPTSSTPHPVHGIAAMGHVKYPSDFKNFDYVNPNAPKGGLLRLADIGTYDSLNPYIIKGRADSGIGLVYGSLLARAGDEPASSYGYVAESIEVANDRSWVVFNLNAKAVFHDGSPVTADDVIYSFNILRTEGLPLFQNYYKQVLKVEKLDNRRIKFSFQSNTSPELPFILGDFPIFSKAYLEKKDFNKTSIDPPLGCGPYRIKSYKLGQTIRYERVKNWWGENLPVHKGRFNFDELRRDYYRDINVAFEAFKSHDIDFRFEGSAKNWSVGYNFPAFNEAKVIKETIENQNPQPTNGLFFNLRRSLFQDVRVRQALNYAFDFEWLNHHVFYQRYIRSNSYFAGSELACSGIPTGDELTLLSSFKDPLPAELLTKVYTLPSTTVPESLRGNLEKAQQLLREAGWVVVNSKLTKDGQPFTFEILLPRSNLEHVFQGFINNLKRLGIDARLRVVDSAQYSQRKEQYDYDTIMAQIPQSASPGNEQREFWSSAAADMPGSYNFAGIKNPVVDELIERLIAAPDRPQLLTYVHALDRVLLWHHYMIQGWYNVGTSVAYWHHLKRPSVNPNYGFDLMTWWSDTASQGSQNKSGA